MTEREVYIQLTNIFREVFDDDELELRPDLSAKDVDGWDSLRHIRLILTIEKHFMQTYPASKVSELKRVDDLVHLIRSYL